jgi:hypothetical protein
MGVDPELEALKLVLKQTFANIKSDIATSKTELSVNSKEVERLHESLRKLEVQMLQLQDGIKKLQEMQPVQSASTASINSVQINTNQEMISKLAELEKKMESQSKLPENGLHAQILRRVDRNRKSLIKKKILSIVSTQELSLPELKDIIVNEQQLCSKASFYRYFEDMKRLGQLNTLLVDDSELVIASKKIETSLR